MYSMVASMSYSAVLNECEATKDTYSFPRKKKERKERGGKDCGATKDTSFSLAKK